MTFKVFLHRKAAKFLEDMNPRVRQRVKEGLESLEDFRARYRNMNLKLTEGLFYNSLIHLGSIDDGQ